MKSPPNAVEKCLQICRYFDCHCLSGHVLARWRVLVLHLRSQIVTLPQRCQIVHPLYWYLMAGLASCPSHPHLAISASPHRPTNRFKSKHKTDHEQFHWHQLSRPLGRRIIVMGRLHFRPNARHGNGPLVRRCVVLRVLVRRETYPLFISGRQEPVWDPSSSFNSADMSLLASDLQGPRNHPRARSPFPRYPPSRRPRKSSQSPTIFKYLQRSWH